MQLSIMIATPVPKRSPLGKSDGSAERGGAGRNISRSVPDPPPRGSRTRAPPVSKPVPETALRKQTLAPPLSEQRERLAKISRITSRAAYRQKTLLRTDQHVEHTGTITEGSGVSSSSTSVIRKNAFAHHDGLDDLLRQVDLVAGLRAPRHGSRPSRRR